EARARGLDVLARRSQREFLFTLGLDRSVEALRASELDAIQRQDVWEGMRRRDRSTRAVALVDPEGLGAFMVMVLGRGVPSSPPCLLRPRCRCWRPPPSSSLGPWSPPPAPPRPPSSPRRRRPPSRRPRRPTPSPRPRRANRRPRHRPSRRPTPSLATRRARPP